MIFVGSGNVVNNLRRLNIRMPDERFDWAHRFNDAILNSNVNAVMNYANLDKDGALSVPTNAHLMPLRYVLGARLNEDNVEIISDY